MTGANDNLGDALAGFAGVVEGGVDHAAKATFTAGPRSCGSFRKVSALQNPGQNPRGADLAGRYLAVQQLQTRPVLRLVDRLA